MKFRRMYKKEKIEKNVVFDVVKDGLYSGNFKDKKVMEKIIGELVDFVKLVALD